MTCNRCSDIHEAQKLGKTQNACCCGCHDTYTVSTTGTTVPNNFTFTSGNEFNTCTYTVNQ